MAISVKRCGEILLREAEKAYHDRNYLRALEIAMSVYGATASTESRHLLEKTAKALESSPIETVVDAKHDEVKTIVEEVEPAHAPAAVPIRRELVKTESASPFKPAASVSVMDTVKSLFSWGEPEVEKEVGSELAGKTEGPTLVPLIKDNMQMAVIPANDGETKPKQEMVIVYPPMNSKEADELYAEALRDADIDAKVGLNQQPDLSPEEKLQVDERAARGILEARDFFEMVDMKLWADVPQVEKAFKKAIFRVHADRNSSPMAQQASEVLISEYKKFKKEPRKYTRDVEARRVGDGTTKIVDPSASHDGYGTGSGADRSDDGFDCYGKRGYTWSAANTGTKAFANAAGVNPEGNGSMYASPLGEAAWLDRIEYSEATAHKFKNGKYQSFTYTGESRSKQGTRFTAKNNL